VTKVIDCDRGTSPVRSKVICISTLANRVVEFCKVDEESLVRIPQSNAGERTMKKH